MCHHCHIKFFSVANSELLIKSTSKFTVNKRHWAELLLDCLEIWHQKQYEILKFLLLKVFKENLTRELDLTGSLRDLWYKVNFILDIHFITDLKQHFALPISKFVFTGGDVVSDDGNGSISIYGETFEDENLDTQHSMAGFVTMANKGISIFITFYSCN